MEQLLEQDNDAPLQELSARLHRKMGIEVYITGTYRLLQQLNLS
ncbi:MAG: hypothetical protein ACTMUB_02070 [cyanobacterium endosymbiont of Rhopalodia musculus]|nr:hypothetical protein [cyanobacterium endosymbiont of Epithemia clementina EcSB]WGT67019.1 hypothetical protein P3F56_07240 [cyanobacterium endosymbiont of Epithemia clementina EcSB]